LFLQIAGDNDLVLVVSYSDGSSVTGTFGPFPDAAAVETAKAALLEAGVEMGRCEVLPLRKVVSQL
jgi:hypothetical protein